MKVDDGRVLRAQFEQLALAGPAPATAIGRLWTDGVFREDSDFRAHGHSVSGAVHGVGDAFEGVLFRNIAGRRAVYFRPASNTILTDKTKTLRRRGICSPYVVTVILTR